MSSPACAPAHRPIDYSKFNDIDTDSEDEEPERAKPTYPHEYCPCESCRATFSSRCQGKPPSEDGYDDSCVDEDGYGDDDYYGDNDCDLSTAGSPTPDQSQVAAKQQRPAPAKQAAGSGLRSGFFGKSPVFTPSASTKSAAAPAKAAPAPSRTAAKASKASASTAKAAAAAAARAPSSVLAQGWGLPETNRPKGERTVEQPVEAIDPLDGLPPLIPDYGDTTSGDDGEEEVQPRAGEPPASGGFSLSQAEVFQDLHEQFRFHQEHYLVRHEQRVREAKAKADAAALELIEEEEKEKAKNEKKKKKKGKRKNKKRAQVPQQGVRGASSGEEGGEEEEEEDVDYSKLGLNIAPILPAYQPMVVTGAVSVPQPPPEAHRQEQQSTQPSAPISAAAPWSSSAVAPAAAAAVHKLRPGQPAAKLPEPRLEANNDDQEQQQQQEEEQGDNGASFSGAFSLLAGADEATGAELEQQRKVSKKHLKRLQRQNRLPATPQPTAAHAAAAPAAASGATAEGPGLEFPEAAIKGGGARTESPAGAAQSQGAVMHLDMGSITARAQQLNTAEVLQELVGASACKDERQLRTAIELASVWLGKRGQHSISAQATEVRAALRDARFALQAVIGGPAAIPSVPIAAPQSRAPPPQSRVPPPQGRGYSQAGRGGGRSYHPNLAGAGSGRGTYQQPGIAPQQAHGVQGQPYGGAYIMYPQPPPPPGRPPSQRVAAQQPPVQPYTAIPSQPVQPLPPPVYRPYRPIIGQPPPVPHAAAYHRGPAPYTAPPILSQQPAVQPGMQQYQPFAGRSFAPGPVTASQQLEQQRGLGPGAVQGVAAQAQQQHKQQSHVQQQSDGTRPRRALVVRSFQGQTGGAVVTHGADGLDEEDQCVVCMEWPRDTLFMDCGHFVTCRGCADKVKAKTGECPICRAPILQLQKIHL